MKNENDIFDNLKNKGPGFKVPENYLKDFNIDLTNEESEIIPKKTGFKVPAAYFNDLEEKLSELTSIILPDDTGFKVPETYFENFTVKTETRRKNRIIHLFRENKSKIIGFSIAASILLLFSIYPVFNNNNTLDFNDLSSNDIENWLEMNSDEISSFELSEFIDDNDEFYATEMFSDQDISDYLLQTDLESWMPDD